MALPEPKQKVNPFAVAFGLFVFAVALNFLVALWVMLAAGVAHTLWPVVPATGYWETYLLTMGLTALLRAVKTPSK